MARPDDGDVLYADQLGTEFPFTTTVLQMVIDLEDNDIYTFTRANYDNISWDVFENSTYYDSGSSSNVQINVTAGLVALDVDNTNGVYAADFTGVGRDGTYTVDDTGARHAITFDATNDEEDFTEVSGGSGIESTITHDTTYRDGSCTVKIANWTNCTANAGDADAFKFSAFGAYMLLATGASGIWAATGTDGTNSWTRSDPVWLRITRVAGRTKTEESTNGSDWSIVTDYTDTANIGTAEAPVIRMGHTTVTSGTLLFSLQSFTVQGLQSSGYAISEKVTAGASAKGVMAIWNVTAGGSGASSTADFSADDGANYDTGLTYGSYQSITDQSTDLVIKINLNKDTAGVQSPYITSYGYQWKE